MGKKYKDCIMENSNCEECSLVSYGRDCHNVSLDPTPQERWQKKVGLISKSYKLDKDLVKEFAEACEKAGTTQAKQLTEMMQNFINKKG